MCVCIDKHCFHCRDLSPWLLRARGDGHAAAPPSRQYRHMTHEELIAAAKEALKQLQERLERTGSLIG
jgi:hypothetical protein